MSSASVQRRVLRPLVFVQIIFFAVSHGESGAPPSVSIFREYLRINTAHPKPDYVAAVAFLSKLASDIGLPYTQLDFLGPEKPLLLVSWHGSDPSLPSILLNSHMDVVPAETEKWTFHPFSASMEGSRVYARGSQDMKCVGIQYLEAVRALKAHQGLKPLRSVHVLFVVDEEVGGAGVSAFTQWQKFPELNIGLWMDEGLASPSPRYRIFYAERSPWWLEIFATGRPGHGSKMFDGSALENLLRSCNAIMQYRDAQLQMVKAGEAAEGEVISVNPVYLKGGIATPTGFVMNLQPSEAAAGFDIRVPPTADVAALERRITEEWAPTSRNMSFSFVQKTTTRNKLGGPSITNIESDDSSSRIWWLLLQKAVERVGKKMEKPEIFPAATDARFVRNLGIPALGFSPMSNTPVLLHDHNEFLDTSEFLKGIEVYREMIELFAFAPSPHGGLHAAAPAHDDL